VVAESGWGIYRRWFRCGKCREFERATHLGRGDIDYAIGCDRPVGATDDDGSSSPIGDSDDSTEGVQGLEQASHRSLHQGIITNEFGSHR
jgi:hypothetical protein